MRGDQRGQTPLNKTSCDPPIEATIDLDKIEREVATFACAKAKATDGRWYRGAWFARCLKHPDGQHPGPDALSNKCELTYELTTQHDYSSYVSSSDHGLVIGSDGERPVLCPADAEFIALAKSTDLDSHVRVLIAEVRKLRRILESGRKP